MSTAPITNAQLAGDSNQVKSAATLTLKAGSTITMESGATFTVPDATWGISKVNGLSAALSGLSGEVDAEETARIAALRNLTSGEAEVSIASAATTNIGGAAASRVAITGTTTITSLGTTTNVIRFVRFTGALTLTHNATTLILPGGANIVTAAGDCATFISNGSGNWRCYDYQQYLAPGTLVRSSRSITAAGIATGGGDFSADRTITVPKASAATVVAGVNDTDAVTALGNAAALSARFNSWVRGTGYVYNAFAHINTAQVQTPGNRGDMAGVPKAQWCGFVDVPSVSIGINITFVFHVCDQSVGSVTNGNPNSLGAVFYQDGLFIREVGATISDRRDFDYAAFRTAYSGKRIWLEILFINGSTSPLVRVDGVNISASFSATNTGTPPDWLSSSLVTTYHYTGYNWPIGEAPLGQWINAHLTQAESDDWRLKRKIPAWVQAGGSQVAMNTGTWGALFGGSTAFITNTPTEIEMASIGDCAGMTLAGYFRAGTRVVYTGNMVSQGGAVSANMAVDGYITLEIGSSEGDISALGSFTRTYTLPIDGAVRLFTVRAIASGGCHITDIKYRVIGAFSLPAVQPIPVLGDGTDIGDNPARLVGMTTVCPKRTIDPITINYAYTGSSIQLLGGAMLDGRLYRVASVTGNSSASVNLSLGTSSSGTQIVNAQAVNGNFDISTFASRLTSGTDFWLTFSGNTSGYITLNLELVK